MSLENIKITNFAKGWNDQEATITTLENFFNKVWFSEDEEYIKQSTNIREFYELYLKGENTFNEYKEMKNSLSTIKFGGTYSSQKKETLDEASFLMFIDIDYKDTEKEKENIFLIDNIKRDLFIKRLKDLPYTVGVAKSCNNYGIRLVIRIKKYKYENEAEYNGIFKQAYEQIQKELKQNYDVEIDKSCSNHNRNCFHSVDLGAYVNYKAGVFGFTYNKRKETTTTPTKTYSGDNNDIVVNCAYDQLKMSNTLVGIPYSQWTQIAQLLTYVYKDDKKGEDWFVKYSQLDTTGYTDETKTRAKYASFNLKPKAGVGTFIHIMQTEYGIDYKELKELKQFILRETFFSCMEEYDFYRNEIDSKYYWRRSGEKKYRRYSEVESLNSIKNEVEAKMRKSITKEMIDQQVKNEETEVKNPFKIIFNGLRDKWDGVDRLKDIFSLLKTDDDTHFELIFVKWYLNMINTVFQDSAPEVALVLLGNQDDGKTFFFENLLPGVLQEFSLVSENFDPSNKDHLYLMCKNLLITFDEMSSYSKAELGILKSVVTSKEHDIRLPFRPDDEKFKRYATIAGTTNESDFLKDYSGDRRYAVFQLLEPISTRYETIDKQQLLCQMLDIYFKMDQKNIRFNREEKNFIIERNRDNFTYESSDEEALKIYLQKDENSVVTFQDVKKVFHDNNINIKLQKSTFGKIMKKMGYNSRKKRMNGNKVTVYLASFNIIELTKANKSYWRSDIENGEFDFKAAALNFNTKKIK